MEDAGEGSGDVGWISHALAGCKRRGYFQTGLLRIVCRLMELLRCGVATCKKEGHLVFSAGHQLLLTARGRERLSHKSNSNWALLCTRCLPRWRYRSR